MEKITVQATIAANKEKVWEYYTNPEHITQWNYASADWCCPAASNDLTIGGKYVARMEAKDGSFGFDFEATYVALDAGESFTYVFGDRYATVQVTERNGSTQVTITFDPETENPVELQQQGWQAILDNFKQYTETH